MTVVGVIAVNEIRFADEIHGTAVNEIRFTNEICFADEIHSKSRE